MRQMPSVTVTTEPTLRASVAAAKFLMRALIRSLISEALMDMSSFPLVREPLTRPCSKVFSTRQFDLEPHKFSHKRAVDQQIAGADDGAADETRVRAAMQAHVALESPAQCVGQPIGLTRIERHRGDDLDVGDVLILSDELRKLLGDLGQIIDPAVLRQQVQECAAVHIEGITGHTCDHVRELLRANAGRMLQALVFLARDGVAGARQPLRPLGEATLLPRVREGGPGVRSRDGCSFSHLWSWSTGLRRWRSRSRARAARSDLRALSDRSRARAVATRRPPRASRRLCGAGHARAPVRGRLPAARHPPAVAPRTSRWSALPR